MNHFELIDLPKLAEEHWKRLIDKPRSDSENIFDRLDNAINHPHFKGYTQDERDFLNNLKDVNYLKKIIIATPIEQEVIIGKINKSLFWNEKESKSTPFGKKVLKIFHYEGFRDSKRLGSGLAESLKIKSCLYCNAQYTISTGNKVYHTFDHFFSKAIYPYLSVSFYNLIPVCNTCNQTKSNKPVSLDTHWHPYFGDSLMSKFQFQIEPQSAVEFAVGKYRDNKILKINSKPNLDPMVKSHFKMFNLEDQYQVHTDIAAETIWKSKIYIDSYRKELENLMSSISLTDSEIKRLIVGNYIEEEDIHKRPLAKLTSDLAKDLGLI